MGEIYQISGFRHQRQSTCSATTYNQPYIRLRPKNGGPMSVSMTHDQGHLLRLSLISALEFWLASARLLMLQCDLIGMPVAQSFLTAYGRVKSAREQRLSAL